MLAAAATISGATTAIGGATTSDLQTAVVAGLATNKGRNPGAAQPQAAKPGNVAIATRRKRAPAGTPGSAGQAAKPPEKLGTTGEKTATPTPARIKLSGPTPTATLRPSTSTQRLGRRGEPTPLLLSSSCACARQTEAQTALASTTVNEAVPHLALRSNLRRGGRGRSVDPGAASRFPRVRPSSCRCRGRC